jgi:hypothetical protein
MEYPNIRYLDPKKLLVIRSDGTLNQLHVPIRVLVNYQLTDRLHVMTQVFIEEIMPHKGHKIIYRIFDHWYPYWGFTLK